MVYDFKDEVWLVIAVMAIYYPLSTTIIGEETLLQYLQKFLKILKKCFLFIKHLTYLTDSNIIGNYYEYIGCNYCVINNIIYCHKKYSYDLKCLVFD